MRPLIATTACCLLFAATSSAAPLKGLPPATRAWLRPIVSAIKSHQPLKQLLREHRSVEIKIGDVNVTLYNMVNMTAIRLNGQGVGVDAELANHSLYGARLANYGYNYGHEKLPQLDAALIEKQINQGVETALETYRKDQAITNAIRDGIALAKKESANVRRAMRQGAPLSAWDNRSDAHDKRAPYHQVYVVKGWIRPTFSGQYAAYRPKLFAKLQRALFGSQVTADPMKTMVSAPELSGLIKSLTARQVADTLINQAKYLK
ncbi:MAG: hypothetical protein H6707_04505 [Deltaproteobacteria bacterium]|nr:hypothetical protein [Deltaproteobacteria bacterium]